MDELVFPESTLQAEGFLTLVTAETLLSCMDKLVSPESTFQAESLPTLVTAEPLLSCMDKLVATEMMLQAEALPTLVTTVWSWLRCISLLPDGSCWGDGCVADRVRYRGRGESSVLDLSAPEQGDIQGVMVPLYVMVEEPLAGVGRLALSAGEEVRLGRGRL